MSAHKPEIETVDVAAAAAISAAEETEPAAGGSDTVVCAKCGMPASAGVRFCIDCGEPVEWWRAGGTGSHANRRLSASAPTPIKKKGIPAGVLVAIFLVLLLVLAGCAFWLWRSIQFSPSTDSATIQIPDDSGGPDEPADDDDGSALIAEDADQPVEQAGDAPGAATARTDTRLEPASANGSSRAGGATANPPGGSRSGGSPPPAARKSAPTPAATTKAVQTAQNTAPPPRSPVPFVDGPPPSSAGQQAAAPSANTAASLPPATAVTQPAPTPVQPTAPAAPIEGIIYWSGKLQRNKRFIISTRGTDYGFADGRLLPGTPVEVRVLSPAVRVVEAPGPNNSWQRIILECTRNTNQSVTVNVQWFAAR